MINRNKSLLCIKGCRDRFYNHNDMTSIRETGMCLYCLRDAKEKRELEAIDKKHNKKKDLSSCE